MIEKFKTTLILASLLILLPIVFAIIEQKAIYVIISAVMLPIFWLCILFTAKDKANEDQNPKVMQLAFWIVPVITLFVSAMIYFLSNGFYVSPTAPASFIFAALFIFMGNYMPKCTRNHTMGIKIKHTLENEENWNATHRFAGKCWFVGGIIMLFFFFLSEKMFSILVIPILLAFVIAPIVYSYVYYKRQVENGTYTVDKLPPYSSYEKTNKRMKIFSAITIPIILIVVTVLMFTGDVTADLTDSALTLNSQYWVKTTIALDEIKSVELDDDVDCSYRLGGFSSAMLQLGNYRNDELGDYISYRYTSSDTVIVLKTDEAVYVLGLDDDIKTVMLYEEILEKLG